MGLIALVAAPAPAQTTYTPYTFTTWAGSAGVTGTNDGTGGAARFSAPAGLAVDAVGNVFVADFSNNTVRKVTPGRVVTTLAGLGGSPGTNDGTGDAARFNGPNGVALDGAGNLYVTDRDNNTVRKLSPNGTSWTVSTLAGLAGSSGSTDGTNSTARFYHLGNLALDSATNLYVADSWNNTIRKVTPAGVVTTVAGLAGSSGSTDGTNSDARFSLPDRVAVDSAGNIYVADYLNSTIRKISPLGTNWVVTTLAGLAGNPGTADGTGSAARFVYILGVAVDSVGDLYISDDGTSSTIRKGWPSVGGAAPVITIQPASLTVAAFSEAAFSAAAIGAQIPGFQWQKNGTNLTDRGNITGASTDGLTVSNCSPSDAAGYRVVVSNAFGVVTSAVAILTVNPVPPCVAPPPGLAGWWPGEGNANDIAGTNNGTLFNGATFASGKVGRAFSFDGTNSYVRVADSPSLHFTNALTIEAWIYPTSLGVFHNIVSKWGVQYPLQTSYTTVVGPDGRIALGVCASGDQSVTPVVNTVSTNSVRPSQWTHFAATYDGSALRMYLNGVCEDQVAYNQGIFPGTEDLAIGAAGAFAGGQVLSPFAGLIDEVSVYSRALSDGEIAAIYNAGVSGKCGLPPLITLQPTNLFVLAGSNVLFAAAATGTPPLSYQWAQNGTRLPSATNTALSLSNVSGLNAGFYTVIVSNSIGSVTSTPALLDVRYALAYGNGGLLPGSNYTFIGSVDLQLWSVFPNGNVFYTLDGSEPSFASSYYAGPFSLNRSATLRVIAYSADFLQAAESPPILFTVIPTYALNLLSPGGGTVTASPPVGPYVSNTVVTLTPHPSNGWTFLEWRGDASGASPTVALTMNRAKTVQAIFGTTLSTTVAGNGAVGVYPALPLYPYSSVARLTAIPQAGSYFGVWGNAASGNTNPLYFPVTSATPTVSSLFADLDANQQVLTVIPDGFGNVTITPRASVYATGANVSLNAISDPGQQFISWSGDATGTQNPLTVSMNNSKIITAAFTRKPSLAVAPPLGGLFEDGFRLTLKGEFGQAYRIDASANLADWLPLTILTNAYGTGQFSDDSATNSTIRFYRASAPTPWSP